MKSFYNCIAFLLCSIFIAGCVQWPDSLKTQLPPGESKFAQDCLDKVRLKNYHYIKPLLGPKLTTQISEEMFMKMASFFRAGDPISIEIIGMHIMTHNGQWQGNFTYEYRFESGWNVANCAIRKEGDSYQIIGLSVHQAKSSQKEINAFTLSSKSTMHYITLFFVLAIPLFSIFTLVTCIRTPILRRKWLWVLGTLVGFGAFHFNWTSGDFKIQLLSLYLFGASATTAGSAAPWILTFSFPIGAVAFWLKRKELSVSSDKGLTTSNMAGKNTNE